MQNTEVCFHVLHFLNLPGLHAQRVEEKKEMLKIYIRSESHRHSFTAVLPFLR